MPETDTPTPDDSYPTLARALGDLARAEEREISQEAARAMLAALRELSTAITQREGDALALAAALFTADLAIRRAESRAP